MCVCVSAAVRWAGWLTAFICLRLLGCLMVAWISRCAATRLQLGALSWARNPDFMPAQFLRSYRPILAFGTSTATQRKRPSACKGGARFFQLASGGVGCGRPPCFIEDTARYRNHTRSPSAHSTARAGLTSSTQTPHHHDTVDRTLDSRSTIIIRYTANHHSRDLASP